MIAINPEKRMVGRKRTRSYVKIQRMFTYFHVLLMYPKKEFTANEFSKDTGIPIATVYRYFHAAASFNMITKIGFVRKWQWAKDHRPMVHHESLYFRNVHAVFQPPKETGVIRNRTEVTYGPIP